MPNVLSIQPEIRITKAGVGLPAELKFHYADVRQADDIIAACRDMDFLFLPATYPPITAVVLENIPSVRMIQSTGAGYDQVDVDTAAALEIPVANSPGHNTGTVTELTVAMIVALQRRLLTADREINAGNYQAMRENLFKIGLPELGETTLGLIGFGAVGRKVAQVAGILGASIRYYDVARPSAGTELALGVQSQSLRELLATCDTISLHIPLTPATRGLIGAEQLACMPAGVYLVNTARGELIDAQALADALENGHIAGAALDTLAPEPPPDNHPLLNLSPRASERLLLSPHIAGTTQGAFHRMLSGAIENLQRVAAGGQPRNVVNNIFKARPPLTGQ